MAHENKIGFSLRKIITKQFAIIEDVYQKNDKVKFIRNLNFDLNIEHQIIGVLAKFTFANEENTPFIIIEVECQFNIHNNSWTEFYNSTSNLITIPKNFSQHLAVITIGTIRGVLHAKTENTNYNKFILPTINVLDIIKEDVSIAMTN